MTSLDSRTQPNTAEQHRTSARGSRIGAGAPLFVGAALVLFLIEPIGSLPTKGWVPILVGLSFVAAGLLGRRNGRHLASGLAIAVWGLAPLSTNYGYEFNGMFYLTLGTGLLFGAILARSGMRAITPMSLALAVLLIGGVMAIAPYLKSSLTAFLALLLVAWGAWEVWSYPDAAEGADADGA